MSKQSITDRLTASVDKVNHVMEVLLLPQSDREYFTSLSATVISILRVRANRKINPEKLDYRLRALLLRGCRKYGETGDNDCTYYGLRCESRRGFYKGLFLLGDNGSGKSSLFNAAEYLMTRKVGEAAYRNLHDVIRYMVNERHPHFDIFAVTAKEELTFGSDKTVVQSMPIEKFFISENSIYEATKYIGQDDNWLGYYCHLIGIDSIYEMVTSGLPSKLIEGIKTAFEVQEMKKIAVEDMEKAVDNLMVNRLSLKQHVVELKEMCSSLLDRFGQGNKNEERLKEFINEAVNFPTRNQLLCVSLFRQELNEREQEYQDAVEKANNQSKSVLVMLKESIFKSFERRISDIYSKLISNLENLKKCLSDLSEAEPVKNVEALFRIANKYKWNSQDTDAVKQITQKDIDDVKDFLMLFERYLNYLMYKTVRTVVDTEYIKLVTDMMKSHFLQDDEVLVISPVLSKRRISVTVNGVSINSYFNTFRFRLFMLMSQSAICLAFMKLYNIIVPIFLDDVFYANDYLNKAQLVKFFDVVYDYAHKLSPDLSWLQIIFFSHDEQLITTLADDYSRKESYMFGRILPLREVVKMRKSRDTIDEKKYFNIYAPIFQNT